MHSLVYTSCRISCNNYLELDRRDRSESCRNRALQVQLKEKRIWSVPVSGDLYTTKSLVNFSRQPLRLSFRHLKCQLGCQYLIERASSVYIRLLSSSPFHAPALRLAARRGREHFEFGASLHFIHRCRARTRTHGAFLSRKWDLHNLLECSHRAQFRPMDQ